MKVLIVDDEPIIRNMLLAITQKWGYHPIIAEAGEQAWEILQQDDPPKLLLIDWLMPGLDGLSLCQRIRNHPTSNPAYIIMITGRKTTEDIVMGLEVGANEYITKPFNVAELQARIQVGRRILTLQQELNDAKELLTFQAQHDVLTGLFNRRAIMEIIDTERENALLRKNTLGIALCDIDFFKRINDIYGHLAGDYLLHEVSQRINDKLSPLDFIGRYGGEEFLFVLNGSISSVMQRLESMRSVIANDPFLYKQQTISITISFGVTFFEPPEDNRSCLTLIDLADKALYIAKEKGRNRVVFYR